MDERPLVALLGEDRGHRSHRELDALGPRCAVPATRVPPDSALAAVGSAYADLAAVLAALKGTVTRP